jgi:hypothetical protein
LRRCPRAAAAGVAIERRGRRDDWGSAAGWQQRLAGTERQPLRLDVGVLHRERQDGLIELAVLFEPRLEAVPPSPHDSMRRRRW